MLYLCMPSFHPLALILILIINLGLLIWSIFSGMKFFYKTDFYENASEFTQFFSSILVFSFNTVVSLLGVTLILILMLGLAQN